ncbi:hypothetical protein MIS24_24050 [Vibrio parahaemolyticus]|nr:hypothetical protein [Vibrio parahaemolyticus]
MVCVGFSG